MKIAVMVRLLDLGYILWCGRVVRVKRAECRPAERVSLPTRAVMSRSLRSRSPHEPLSGWPRTLPAKVKQQRRAFDRLFFEVGVGRPFLEIEVGKRTRSTRIPRCRVRFTRP